MQSELDALLQFTRLIHRFAQIERTIFATGLERRENDAEHSFQLALTAWYLNDSRKLGLTVEKLLVYSLAHDLVELHAGDTFAYTADRSQKTTKHDRELAAAEQLAKEYPEFPALHEAIAAYEKREDRESKFIYTLDKLLPMMNTYLDGGRSWQHDHITLPMILEYKTEKMKLSPETNAYFQALVELVKGNENELFGRV